MLKLCLAVASAGILFSQSASAAVLDFSGNICGGAACSDFDDVDQSYGDVAGQIDVVYDGDTTAAGNQAVLFWDDWDGLNFGVYGYDNGTGLNISLVAAAGYEVTLNSFGIGWDTPTARDTSVVVTDLLNGSVFSDTGLITNENAVGTYLVGSTSTAGFSITLGPDAYYSGIGDISYTVSPIGGMTAVPLPAAGWLLLAGMGGLAAMRRKQK